MNKKVSDIVSDILITVDDTYDLFIELTENRSEKFVERVIEKLSNPFDALFDNNIRLFLYVDGGFDYHYSEEDFNKADENIEEYDSPLRYDEVRYRATEYWIKRKQQQINELLSKNKKDKNSTQQNIIYNLQILLQKNNNSEKNVTVINVEKKESPHNKETSESSNSKDPEQYPTFTKSSKITLNQIENLFKELNRLNIIEENIKNIEKFTDCFTQNKLVEQPKIKFYGEPIILFHFFKLMYEYNLIINLDKSSRFKKNQLFVNRDGKPFVTSIKDGVYSLKDLPSNKVQKELVKI